MLSETRDPTRVQPFVSKCFPGIAALEIDDIQEAAAMISKNGERGAETRLQITTVSINIIFFFSSIPNTVTNKRFQRLRREVDVTGKICFRVVSTCDNFLSLPIG